MIMKKNLLRFYEEAGMKPVEKLKEFTNGDALWKVSYREKEYIAIFHSQSGTLDFTDKDMDENPELKNLFAGFNLMLKSNTEFDYMDIFSLVTILRTFPDEYKNQRCFTLTEDDYMKAELLGVDATDIMREKEYQKFFIYNRFAKKLLETMREYCIEKVKKKYDSDNFASKEEWKANFEANFEKEINKLNDMFDDFYRLNWNSMGVYS